MKKILVLVFFMSLCSHAQELSGRIQKIEFPKSVEEIPLRVEKIPSLSSIHEWHEYGRFYIPELDFEGTSSKPLDMMALADAERYRKQRQIVEMNFGGGQLQEKEKGVQFFWNQHNFSNRTGNDLNFNGRRTPDGGIRNEVYEEVRQPLMNPFYGNGFYNRGFQRRVGNSNIYFTR